MFISKQTWNCMSSTHPPPGVSTIVVSFAENTSLVASPFPPLQKVSVFISIASFHPNSATNWRQRSKTNKNTAVFLKPKPRTVKSETCYFGLLGGILIHYEFVWIKLNQTNFWMIPHITAEGFLFHFHYNLSPKHPSKSRRSISTDQLWHGCRGIARNHARDFEDPGVLDSSSFSKKRHIIPGDPEKLHQYHRTFDYISSWVVLLFNPTRVVF